MKRDVTELRKTFMRVAEMVGAKTDKSTVAYYKLGDKSYISVYENDDRNTVWLSLIQNRDIVACETIKVGASDRVIQNRINKILAADKA